jgi:Rad3-related DNA helicase
LVDVLREALSLDAVARAKEAGRSTSKTVEDRNAAAFIQNIHHFRDEALTSSSPPNEKVAVFDEAQRLGRRADLEIHATKEGAVGFRCRSPSSCCQ